MKPRHKRLAFILAGLGGVVVAAVLILTAFRSNVTLFFSPTELADGKVPHERSFRLGGLVEEGSLRRENDGLTVHFVITDLAHTVPVTYKGILPDLFKEGQGAVAQGRMGSDGVFHADEVLAKHDEKYMPPEVAKALEKGQARSQEMNNAAPAGAPGGI